MKKLLFIMFTLSMIAFTSCSNEENFAELSKGNGTEVNDSIMQTVQQNMELQKLKSNIDKYNSSIFDKNNETRISIGKFFKKLWYNVLTNPWIATIVTVSADALGGLVTGGFGAASSGIIGFAIYDGITDVKIVPMPNHINTRLGTTSPNGNNIPDSLLNNEDVIFKNTVPELSYQECFANDSIGYYHNKILYGIFSDKEKLNEFVNKDQQAQAEAIINEMKNIPYIQNIYGTELNNQAIITSGINIANSVKELAQKVDTEEEFLNGLIELGLTDIQVIDVLREVIEGLSKIDPSTDSGEYYQNILDMVANSDIDINIKQQLADGIIIGQASNHLWKKVPLDYGSSEEGLGAQ